MNKSLIQLINNNQIIFIRGRGPIDEHCEQGRKLLMSKLYHSDKLPGTKAYFSSHANLTADNIFFDEYLNEIKFVFEHLLIARQLGKRFFIATNHTSELWWQPQYNGVAYLDISVRRNESWDKLAVICAEDRPRRLVITDFIKKTIPVLADDYDNLTKQYLGQGIINHDQEISLW